MFILKLVFLLCQVYASVSGEMVKIKGGVYTPFFDRGKEGKNSSVVVEKFFIDKLPVSNAQFLKFVKNNSSWRRSKVKPLFAEKKYLSHWLGDLKVAKKDLNRPVKFVSWFAANAYCEYHGKTLPKIVQWEYVASADEKEAFAVDKDEYKQRILTWYSKPSTSEPPVIGQGVANYWGVYDLHGMHWEWNLDFNAALVTGESREDGIINKNLFCGSGSLGAKDKLDYGAFMRFGFRSSLKANYTINNLGFRCVKNMEVVK